MKNAKTYIEAGGDARWDMLVFYNLRSQPKTCEQLSRDMDPKGFNFKHTTRFKQGKFDVIDDDYNITHTLYPSNKSLEMIAPAQKAQNELMPKDNL